MPSPLRVWAAVQQNRAVVRPGELDARRDALEDGGLLLLVVRVRAGRPSERVEDDVRHESRRDELLDVNPHRVADDDAFARHDDDAVERGLVDPEHGHRLAQLLRRRDVVDLTLDENDPLAGRRRGHGASQHRDRGTEIQPSGDQEKQERRLAAPDTPAQHDNPARAGDRLPRVRDLELAQRDDRRATYDRHLGEVLQTAQGVERGRLIDVGPIVE